MSERGTRTDLGILRRRRRPPAWFVRWYWRHFIAANRCPCSWWPETLQRFRLYVWLVYLCGRMDDEYERLTHLPFYTMVLDANRTTSSAGDVTVTWTRKHG